jgi:hypothetical protein
MRRSIQSLLLATAAAAGTALGCVVYVEDECLDVDCGDNATCDRGMCECYVGYDGDPDEACDPIQTVLIQDQCDDGLDTEFVLWSADRSWRWPGGSEEPYLTAGYGAVTYVDIVCYEGEWVCFGAQAGDLAWGVGLDGTDACEDDWCCFECFPDTVDLGLLTCG